MWGLKMAGAVATGDFRAEHGTRSNKKLGLATLLRAPIKETSDGEKQRNTFIQCGFMGRRTDQGELMTPSPYSGHQNDLNRRIRTGESHVQ